MLTGTECNECGKAKSELHGMPIAHLKNNAKTNKDHQILEFETGGKYTQRKARREQTCIYMSGVRKTTRANASNTVTENTRKNPSCRI